MSGAIHAVSGTRRSVPASEAVERPTALVALPLHGRSPLHDLVATSAFEQRHVQPFARAGVRRLHLRGQEATTSLHAAGNPITRAPGGACTCPGVARTSDIVKRGIGLCHVLALFWQYL